MAPATATHIAQVLDISRSYLYYLRDNGVFSLETTAGGRPKWDSSVIPQIQEYLASKKPPPPAEAALPYKTSSINNRRYLGNKYKLLPFIKEIVEANCENVQTVADIFAGTGAVASAFTGKKIITNDMMYSNYICNEAWFGTGCFSEKKLIRCITAYNQLQVDEENYMTKNFSDTFFSRGDCAKIGFIRADIEKKFDAGEINDRERALLITSLLYAMDKIANTCGHYDAYRQNAEFEKSLELTLLTPSPANPNNRCFHVDANELVRNIEADLVYIDPPYNSRQYCDAYHLLENVARWEKPEVHGVARKMDRSKLKSDYCTTKAAAAFDDLIKNIKARYILLSYNNMAEKGNDRSNAKISDDDIMRILSAKGEVRVFSQNYKAFTTGKSDITENEERLFLCTCLRPEKEMLQSPLNYIGGKFKLLPQILPLFPKNISLFVDLFCGGCNVGINADCSRVIFNDSERSLLSLYNTFKNLDKDSTFAFIDNIIDQYGLSRSGEYGYAHYGCNSASGLGSYNKPRFLKLREAFNGAMNEDYFYYVMLYVLLVYAFNNQIRFNSKGAFNLPVGKRDFNSKMKMKLSKFIDRLKSGDYHFTSHDFRQLDLTALGNNSFVYADPPYLITCATYNERGGWTEACERDLLSLLDTLHHKNIRFALSNVLSSKGKTNEILLEWLEQNDDKYRVIDLNFNYANSNYQTKGKTNSSREVLIVNY